MLSIAEELLLLLIDEDIGEYTAVPARTLGYALTGATLIELELRHRIDVSPEALVVTDPTPVDDDLLDPVLADIVAESRNAAHNAEFWVRRIAQSSDELRTRALAGLAAQGMIEADESGFFFLSRRATLARHYGPNQSRQAEETRQRILQAIFSDVIPDTRDIVIISLAHACDIFQRILPTDEYEEAHKRIEIISRLEMISRSVIDGIRNLTLAEAYALRRRIREKGGGWPRASGHLPIIGHVLQFRNTINGFLTEQYRNLGPVFEVSLLGKKWLVLAGPEANRFLMREGRDCLHNDHVAWQGFAQQFGSTRALAGMDGPEHVRLRRLMRDGYSRGQLVKDIPQAVAIIENEMRQWPENRPVSVYPSVQRMVVDQLGTLMSGISPRGHVDDILTFIHAAGNGLYGQDVPEVYGIYAKGSARAPACRSAL